MDPPKEDISNENEGEGSPKREDEKPERKKQRDPIKKGKPKTKLIIKYNKSGVPIGLEAIELATFKGMVARTMVPISYDDWRHVPEDLKKKIWDFVCVSY